MANKEELQILLTMKDEASKKIAGVKGKIQDLQPAFRKMALIGTASFLAVAGTIGKVLNTAGELEQQTIAFETMLGSTENALEMLKKLSDFATKTPFEIQGIRQTAKMLLAMGIGEDALIGTLKSLGDVSAGLSVPLERIALNYGQIKTQGKLTGRELRDFAVSGVPLVDELAKSFGVSKEKIAEMVSAGEIGFPAVEQAFKNMSGEGGKFADLMDKQSKSMKGQWSNLKDQFTLVAEQIGSALIPMATKLLNAVIPLIEKVGKWIEENPKLASGILLAVAGLTGLVAVVGLLGMALPAIITGFGLLFSPITLIILAIGSLIAVGVLLWKNWDTIILKLKIFGALFKSGMQEIAEFFKGLWKGVADFFIGIWDGIKNGIVTGLNWVIDKLNVFVRMYNKILTGLNKIPTVNLEMMGEIPHLAEGGVVTEPTTALIGESGAEAIVPLNKMNGMGTTVNITVNGDVDGQDLLDKIKDSLMTDLKFNNRLTVGV